MEKYKICPGCGAHNTPLNLECYNCETDLQSVPVVDKEMEQLQVQARRDVDSTVPIGTMIRICDCGARNPVQARQCSSCGEDISMVIPTQDQATAVQQVMLSSIDGTYAFELTEGVTVIGRENEMRDYLARKPYVSRRHAELTLEGGKLSIQNCNTTNYTFINNVMLSGDECVNLKDGDEIGLGGNEQGGSRQAEAAYFLVRIGSCM